MSRTLFSIAIPSLLAGGLLFGSAFTRADVGPDAGLGFWPTAGPVVAQAAPTPPHPPHPPTPPPPPTHGVTVNIRDGKIDITGIEEMVQEQIDNAQKSIDSSPLSADVKAKLRAKLEKTKSIVKKRLKDAKNLTPEEIGEEMGKMGEEIGEEMEGFGEEMEKFGEEMDKQGGSHKAPHVRVHVAHAKHDADHDQDGDDDDDDDMHEAPMAPGVAMDMNDDDDMKEALKGLADLALTGVQRQAITKLRVESDKTVADAKQQLDVLSGKLHDALGDAKITDADVARYVDQISAQEAAIRKARLIAWVHARAVLDAAQRKKIEDAAKKKSK